jgi:acyl-CoA dehydrogenase
MIHPGTRDIPQNNASTGHTSGADCILPQTWAPTAQSAGSEVYRRDPAVVKLIEFFDAKGLAALKEQDRCETWYDDWIAYQAEHRLYAQLLSPAKYSTFGGKLDLLRYARFLEVFGYFSPAHGYSLQVTFLGLGSILMGPNESLKREAVALLEAGGLLAFGVSEQGHGADLLANAFVVREAGPGRFVANGSKYYIGNANSAGIISILARQETDRSAGRARRAPPALFALRPKQSPGFGNVRKIRTLGVRGGFVGAFEVKDHELTEADVIAQGRCAWDAVIGTVTLGKFFLGFGSIGICQHALAEAATHLTRRLLYGKPVLDMPHIRSLMAQAYARLSAMKLYAYRALDYVHGASASDRRYLLFAAVQKAKVSTEGVKVMAMLSECVGAKGFESDTYLEMALRDVQLIPSLEGSTHINLEFTAQFIARYFAEPDAELVDPEALSLQAGPVGENPFLMQASTGAVRNISFGPFLDAYKPLAAVPNIRLFVRQVKAFKRFVKADGAASSLSADLEGAITLGKCLATICYGQLVAENASRLNIAPQQVSAMFHGIVEDLSIAALALASLPGLGRNDRALIRRMIAIPRTRTSDWDLIAERVSRFGA